MPGLAGLAALYPGRAGAAAGPGAATAGQVIAELETQGTRYLNVARSEAQWLQLLVKVSRARAALEVGTSFGYSALWIGQALEESDGKLITLDINPERVELARQHLARAGLSRRVDCREGDGHELVPKLEGAFDFVFLDADKDGCLDYFERLYPAKLSPGALLLAHSAVTMREWMKNFLERLEAHPDFDAAIVTAGAADGFLVSYRHRTQETKAPGKF
jgi:predicted O-methyltransferase YrrM